MPCSASSPASPLITSSLEVPLIRSPPAVPENVAAKATPESATTSIATVITIVAVRLMSCPFSVSAPASPGALDLHSEGPRGGRYHANELVLGGVTEPFPCCRRSAAQPLPHRNIGRPSGPRTRPTYLPLWNHFSE